PVMCTILQEMDYLLHDKLPSLHFLIQAGNDSTGCPFKLVSNIPLPFSPSLLPFLHLFTSCPRKRVFRYFFFT
ncbi:uncharacterized protein BX663DRAFT_433943, partial [Cokeromyces recurvatus]|uniref:uncharacterized protein n=1 Tax=Cokeromyces recurvatus TaxID=90255 RepID=UPI002221056C